MPNNSDVDVLCIGNAIVDILGPVEDDFLAAQGIAKGSMTLVEVERVAALEASMRNPEIVAGGSAANTAVGLACFGVRTAYAGKVKSDVIGALFADDIRRRGVAFETEPAAEGPETARCCVLVTPDGQRTMNTYLGACLDLDIEDVPESLTGTAGIVFFEGYLWDPPMARAAVRRSIKVAKANGAKVAITLSDAFCVDRYRDDFMGMIRDGSLDVVFANETELHALYQTANLDTAVAALRNEGITAAVTLGAAGSMVVERRQVTAVDAFPVDRLIDTTGAGDFYAAGFLAGLTKGLDARGCATLGGLAASDVIQNVGARPRSDLKEAAARLGLLA